MNCAVTMVAHSPRPGALHRSVAGPGSRWVRGRLLVAGLALAAGACTGRGDTGITLRIESPTDIAPTHLDLLWLAPDREILRRRIPARGALVRPTQVSVLIETDAEPGERRIAVVRGFQGDLLVSEGVGKGAVARRRWVEVPVNMQRGPLSDEDRDGIPDEAGFCPPAKSPCASGNDAGAMDAGLQPDADAPAGEPRNDPDAGVPMDTAAERAPDHAPERAAPEPAIDAPAAVVDAVSTPDLNAEAPRPPPPDTAPAPVDMRINPQTGVRGTYFRQLGFVDPGLTRIDPVIDFEWGTGAPVNAADGDRFSVRWEGHVHPVYSETYTLHLSANDWVTLWLDDQPLIDSRTGQPPTEHTASIALTAGRAYRLTLAYEKDDYPAQIRLEWSSRSQQRQVIPENRLSPPMR